MKQYLSFLSIGLLPILLYTGCNFEEAAKKARAEKSEKLYQDKAADLTKRAKAAGWALDEPLSPDDSSYRVIKGLYTTPRISARRGQAANEDDFNTGLRLVHITPAPN